MELESNFAQVCTGDAHFGGISSMIRRGQHSGAEPRHGHSDEESLYEAGIPEDAEAGD